MANLGRMAAKALGVGGKSVLKATGAVDRTVARGADMTMRGLIKKADPSYLNAFTGLEPTKAATSLFVAGSFGYAGYKSLQGTKEAHSQGGGISYQGAPPIFAGDGIQNTTNAPTLGASGSLVFGLNQKRRG